MGKKILVTYATRAGSTVEIATTIAGILNARGFNVDLKPAREKPDVNNYEGVIIGSAVRIGKWLPEAATFIENNQVQLTNIPTAFFTVHMLNLDDSETSKTLRDSYTTAVRQLVTPVENVYFTGRMDYARLSFLDSVIARMVENATHSQTGDMRDWNRIKTWANTIFA
jgi:menaquinone-dependent protoporphyrinogen oxidase